MKGLPRELKQRLEFKENYNFEAAPPDLKKIHHEPKPCEDCKLTVTDRRLNIQYRGTPYAHWAVFCNSCKLMRDPDTKQFALTKEEYAATLRARKSKKTK